MSVFGEGANRRMMGEGVLQRMVGERGWRGDGEGGDMQRRMERIIADGRKGMC